MMLSFQNVSKLKKTPNQREKQQILSETSFKLDHGDRLCIIGNNNTETSVVLRLVSGAVLPSAGKIIRNGKFSPPIGYVGSFHKELTGEENIRFTCKLYNHPPTPVIDFVGNFIQNHEALKQPMKTYKDGLGKSIAFGLSIAMDFDTYIAKTPIASGSKEFQKKCMDAFAEKTKNSSLIIATSSIKMAQQHTNKALVVHQGSATLFEELEAGLDYFKTLTANNNTAGS